MRTLKYATEKLLGVHLTADHPVLPFLVMMACSTVNRGRRGVDGRTPYERRYGKPWSGKMARFGEKVHWLPLGQRASRVDSGFRQGIFLGLAEGTGRYYIGLEGQVEIARAVKMMTQGDSVDIELFNAVRGTPWRLDPSQMPRAMGGSGRGACAASCSRGGSSTAASRRSWRT